MLTGLAIKDMSFWEALDDCVTFFPGFGLTVILYLLSAYAVQDTVPSPGAVQDTVPSQSWGSSRFVPFDVILQIHKKQ